MSKELHVYCFVLNIKNGNEISRLTNDKLHKFFKLIREIPINITLKEKSRYYKDQLCFIFADELDIKYIVKDEFISGVIVSRTENRPFEDTGTGSISEIKLSSRNNEIAHLVYVVIHVKTGIVFWVNYSTACSIKKFALYLAYLYKNHNFIHEVNLPPAFEIDFSFLKNIDSEKIFSSELFLPISLNLNIAIDENELRQGNFLSDGDEIRMIKELANVSNSSTIQFILKAKTPSSREKKLGKYYSLNKSYIQGLLKQIQNVFFINKKKKCIVNGIDLCVDNEIKVLDLIDKKLLYNLSIDVENKNDYINVLEKLEKLFISKLDELQGYIV